jgi:hypothetical protein
MAEAYNTLAGLVQFNDKNLADISVSDLLDRAPLISAINTVPASNGTLHKYLKQTVASSASFRAALDGITKVPSQDELVTVTLKIIDGSFDADTALAKGYKDGVDAYLQLEMARTLRQVFFNLERQAIYGTKQKTSAAYLADENGFTGLANSAALDATADEMVIAPATTPGTTADSQTSVYLIRHGMDDVSLVLGNDGQFTVEEPTIIQKAGSVGGTYPAWYVAVNGWAGLQLGGARSAARICNIEAKLDDDDLYNALSLFPSGAGANAIVMNRKALKLLRQSRTAVNPSGQPAPMPTNLDGIPIIVTDAVRNDEPVIA